MVEIKSGIEIGKQVQFKSGIEIHQQLDTHKLFCNCPSLLRNDEPEFQVKRKLHAVAGESGEIDIAAKHEAEQDKEFIYQGYDSTCLVELDEEPPHLINQEALQTALHIALLLNCEIIPIAQVMRKTVVDGSNTSGFQRTALIARNGYVETDSGKVGIENIFLEEDSGRPPSGSISSDKLDEDSKITRIWKLDRLGVPLVEITTAPDIKTPEQAKEVALHIGDILRSCKVKRGIGTIRQDINISIPEHPRTEIKGFQDPKMMIRTVELEVERQKSNLKTKEDLVSQVRGALPDGTSKFQRPMPGASRMYPETDLPLLRISRDILNKAKASLPKLRSEVKGELIEKGLSEEQVKSLMKQNKLEEFKALLNIIDEPKFIFKSLIEIPKGIASRNVSNEISVENVLTIDIIESIIEKVVKKEISKEDVKHVMEEIVSGKSFDEAIKIEKANLGDIEGEIANLIKSKPGLSVGGYMGLIMKEFKGKISGKEVNEILSRLLG
ncbi:Glu-tRNA(Gln) amidotransferase subunit GatE [archaeon]|jgi:Glu-tRNA(Gln) amidotransferase subunit E-like FAD-binding protein|nr:Glu-tRNA(Gln) amidotransferase subunit GatE [archaeon]MBT4241823.1 Glu-tRNA(Gln) amidotransferase subunit GatE [archaeon]MBT4418371.1 Glu-tRNA(Gln) amidotransferase subunit GatE [archaeon]